MNTTTERLSLPDSHSGPSVKERNAPIEPEPPRVLSDFQEMGNITAQATASGVEGAGIVVTAITEKAIGAVNASSIINTGHGLLVDVPVNIMHWLRARNKLSEKGEQRAKRATHFLLSCSGAYAISEAGMTATAKTAQLVKKTDNPLLDTAGTTVQKVYDTIAGLPASPFHGLHEKAPSALQMVGAGMQPLAVGLSLYMLNRGVKDVYGSRAAVFEGTDVHAKRIQTRYRHFFSDGGLSIAGVAALGANFLPNYAQSPAHTISALAVAAIGYLTIKAFPFYGEEFKKGGHNCGHDHGRKDTPDLTSETVSQDPETNASEENDCCHDGHNHPQEAPKTEAPTTVEVLDSDDKPEGRRRGRLIAMGAAVAVATTVGLLTNDTEAVSSAPSLTDQQSTPVHQETQQAEIIDLPDSVTADIGDSIWRLVENRSKQIEQTNVRDHAPEQVPITPSDAATFDIVQLTLNLNSNAAVIYPGQQIVLPSDDIFRSRMASAY